jgi:hypothetical protein
VTRADDSSLNPEDLRAVERRARGLLDRAAAWGTFPTPVDVILKTAEIQIAPSSVFDPAAILAYIKHKGADFAHRIKSAVSKVLGLYDAQERIIHIDDTVVKAKQSFLKLHETGHHEMPTHRKMFTLFQDCEQTLAPEIADQFEREANNFARFVLFQGDAYARCAADCPLEIRTPMKLAGKFGASIYASSREFARTHHRACVVYVLEPIRFVPGNGAEAVVRRIEPSPSFERQFGRPTDRLITPDHFLGSVLPIGRKMTRPVSLSISDLNGDSHECLAEAFDTQHNIVILLYPIKALSTTRVVLG